VGRGPLPTNSFHHQGIKRLGSGLKIAATTPDQLVEAVESPEHRFVLGVQWHPELMAESCPAARALFEGFVRAAEGE
jgi:putative glutamine amidotransferase